MALGYCQSNPLLGVERAKPREFNPEILSPNQAKRLLKTCVKIDAELVSYAAICLFAGLRPEECFRLEWQDVEMEENHILVRAETSKTRTRRFVEIEPNLARKSHTAELALTLQPIFADASSIRLHFFHCNLRLSSPFSTEFHFPFSPLPP